MIYSIKGLLDTSNNDLIKIFNKYFLWKLSINKMPTQEGEFKLDFEVHVGTEVEKTLLFDELKVCVDEHGGVINWHECGHDGKISSSCEFAEVYRG